MKKSLSVGVSLAAAAALAGGFAVNQASANTGGGSATVKNVAVGAPSSAPAVTAATPARVFAVVNADASVLRGKAVASSISLGTGVYDVRFNRNISNCAWGGTVGFGSFSGSTGPAMITITGRAGTNNGLFVTTFNSAGTPTNLPFTATVICS